MAKKVILGTDIARDAFKVKVNENFTELYNKDVALEQSINSLDAERKKYAQFTISANQSIPDSVATQIVWTNKTSFKEEDFCEIDATTGRIKILKEGMYEINLNISLSGLSSTTGVRNIWTDFLQSFVPANGVPNYLFNAYFKYCTAGTLLNSRVSHAQGNAIDVSPSSTVCNVRKVV